MDFSNPRTQALLWRAVIGLLLVELPVVSFQLAQPTFDYKMLAIGLLGAAAAYLEKRLSPQLADTYLQPREGTPDPPRSA